MNDGNHAKLMIAADVMPLLSAAAGERREADWVK